MPERGRRPRTERVGRRPRLPRRRRRVARRAEADDPGDPRGDGRGRRAARPPARRCGSCATASASTSPAAGSCRPRTAAANGWPGRCRRPASGTTGSFREDDGRGVRLIVTPGRCHLPARPARRGAGRCSCTRPRSRESWGIGDLADLRRLGEWSSAQGAELLLCNPLHASIPVPGFQQASPYYPSSRCFRSPLYLRVEDVPGARELGAELDERPTPAGAERVANIDRDAVLELKLDALRRIFADLRRRRRLRRVRARRRRHAAAVRPPLRRWPRSTARTGGSGRSTSATRRRSRSREFAREESRRVEFHLWLQWLLDAAAGRRRLVDRVDAGPGHRRRPRRRRRVDLAGRARARHLRRRAARRVQHGRPGLGPAAVRPVEAARRARTSRSSRRCGPGSATPAGCASTT